MMDICSTTGQLTHKLGNRIYFVTNLTGRTVGNWTVLGFSHKGTARGQYYWLCRCKCGVTKPVLGLHLKSRRTTNCGCTGWNLKPAREVVINACFQSSKRFAEQHELPFNITPAWVAGWIFKPCHYCGHPGSNQRYKGVVCNGIDRVRNELGYTPLNCVPCCWACNKAKSDRCAEEFLEHAKRIATFQRISKKPKKEL